MGKKLEPVVCPICGKFSSKRFTAVEQHMNDDHGKTLQQVWNELNNGPVKCHCGCDQETQWYGWKKGYAEFIVGHNGNLVAAHGEEKAREISEKRRQKLIGQVGWAKGLTKENDERVAERAMATSVGRKKAFDDGRIKIWSAGQTKDTNDRLATMATNSRLAFENGSRIAWAKGKTEDDDERILKKNEELREKYRSGELVQWHKGKTIETDSRLDKAWKSRNAMKEYAHIRFSSEQIREHLINNKILMLISSEQYKNANKPGIFVKCVNCDWQKTVTLPFAKNDRCPSCSPSGSIAQHQIADWLESTFGICVGRNVTGIIGKQELDIYVPEFALAIEFNGLYWHNEKANKDVSYHQNKTTACKNIGISLIHIFEDEWRDAQDIIKSMITSRLRKTPNNVHARECKIVKLKPSQKKEFFLKNHLDGDTPSIAAWGLVDKNNSVVYAISVRQPFHRSNNNKLEIARMCPKTYHNVPGGMSRLLKVIKEYAIAENYDGLITYVDTRHGGDGKGYIDAGFDCTKSTSPRFWWTDFHDRFNRFKYKADRPHGLTEAQVAEEAGVTKIWGCSNLVYEMKLIDIEHDMHS